MTSQSEVYLSNIYNNTYNRGTYQRHCLVCDGKLDIYNYYHCN